MDAAWGDAGATKHIKKPRGPGGGRGARERKLGEEFSLRDLLQGMGEIC